MATPTTTIPASEQAQPAPLLNLYHCLCTNLVLATTYNLSDLPQRAKPCLDAAYILPWPAGGGHLDLDDLDANEDLPARHDHTFVLSFRSGQPIMIRGEEGFEKRYPLCCDRCKLVVAYQLDHSQFSQETEQVTAAGTRHDVLFVLPGGLVTTAEMKEGKLPSENIAARI